VGTYPVLKLQKVIKILKSFGFHEVRQKGSHKQFRHNDGRVTPVPSHQDRDISLILLRQIVKDINMTVDEFFSKQ